jgi:hypothetical protein
LRTPCERLFAAGGWNYVETLLPQGVYDEFPDERVILDQKDPHVFSSTS